MRIAVIGAGYWGVNLVRVFHQLGVLARICDSSAARLQELSAKYPDVTMDSSCDLALADPSVEGVVIATPAEPWPNAATAFSWSAICSSSIRRSLA